MENDDILSSNGNDDNKSKITEEEKVFLELIGQILLDSILEDTIKNKSLPCNNDKPLPM